MIRFNKTVNNRSKASMQTFYDAFKALMAGDYEVYVTDAKKSRSARQRRYFWPVIVKLISEHTGYEKDEVNEILKFKFNKKEIQLPDGSFIKVGSSIEKESPARVEEIYEDIRRWAMLEMDLYIPLPGELPDIYIVELHALI